MAGMAFAPKFQCLSFYLSQFNLEQSALSRQSIIARSALGYTIY